ncbi:MAG: aminomethyltransferase, partial [Candidatus Rokuibacteriota bacterium]
PSPARPGDYVTLVARLDLIAAVSACPQDLAPTNAGRVTDLRVRLE